MPRLRASRLAPLLLAAGAASVAGRTWGELRGPAVAAAAASECPPANFSTVQGFNLDSFLAGRWYVQQQMEVSYLPKSQNFCVYAEYAKKEKPSFWGYELSVHNHAEDVAPPHAVHDPGWNTLCAKVVDAEHGKLEVAPCFLPTLFAGPYWVVDYSEAEGYALISGGAPRRSSPGGCRTGTGVNNAGLWIFTRRQPRDQPLVDKVRAVAAAKGFDLEVLNDVDHSQCSGSGLRGVDA